MFSIHNVADKKQNFCLLITAVALVMLVIVQGTKQVLLFVKWINYAYLHIFGGINDLFYVHHPSSDENWWF